MENKNEEEEGDYRHEIKVLQKKNKDLKKDNTDLKSRNLLQRIFNYG